MTATINIVLGTTLAVTASLSLSLGLLALLPLVFDVQVGALKPFSLLETLGCFILFVLTLQLGAYLIDLSRRYP